MKEILENLTLIDRAHGLSITSEFLTDSFIVSLFWP